MKKLVRLSIFRAVDVNFTVYLKKKIKQRRLYKRVYSVNITFGADVGNITNKREENVLFLSYSKFTTVCMHTYYY